MQELEEEAVTILKGKYLLNERFLRVVTYIIYYYVVFILTLDDGTAFIVY